MELEYEDGGTRIPLESGSSKQIGRGPGLYSSDRAVSRRHLSLQLLPPRSTDGGTGTDPDGEARVSFEVIGKNPILVVGGGGPGCSIFGAGEKGELGAGDRVSLSLQNPIFLLVKKVVGAGGGEVDVGVLDAVRRREERTLQRRREKEQEEEEEDRRRLEREKGSGNGGVEERSIAELDLGFEPLDLSNIDPVKEFGFFARGHEFNHYPRQKIRAMKDWNWFLDELKETSDDDEDPEEKVHRRKKAGRGKRKGEDNVDEEWTSVSEDENKLVANVASANMAKYYTRSKDKKRQHKNALSGTKQTKGSSSSKDDIDEEDETLGGFIVNDEEEDEDNVEEDEEEEEFDDEEEEDE